MCNFRNFVEVGSVRLMQTSNGAVACQLLDVLRPGQEYGHLSLYRFSVQA